MLLSVNVTQFAKVVIRIASLDRIPRRISLLGRILDFFRCPAQFAEPEARVPVQDEMASALRAVVDQHPDWITETDLPSSACEQLIECLLMEHYEEAQPEGVLSSQAIRRAYYLARPLLGISVRRLLQKWFLRNWAAKPFPKWPVDRTVDSIHEQMLIAAMKLKGVDRVPFIWFWPDGHNVAVLVTHDVESKVGLDSCPRLMQWDDSYGIKSAFQIIPEERYHATEAQLDFIRDNGFEINVHDLNHDGLLFKSKHHFLDRVQRINAYGKKFRSRGFRAGAMYRNQNWSESFNFEYDMSVPNVAHLDPQHGGCCTMFPYFIGKLLELPVTMIQDYSLFNILGDHSISVWQKQLDLIKQHYGLAHVITHPDYLLDLKAQQTYQSLLAQIAEQRDRENLWITLPARVNDWWRQRSQMELKYSSGTWEVCGEGSSRARVAYAELKSDRLEYDLLNQPKTSNSVSAPDCVLRKE